MSMLARKPLGDFLNRSQYGLSNYSIDDGTIPILKMNNLIDGYVKSIGEELVSISQSEFKKFRLSYGDILFNRTNSLDLVGKTAVFLLPGDYVFASYLVRLSVNPDVADPFFINYYMNSEIAKRYFKAMTTKGVSQANINPTKLLKELNVPTFSLQEQRKIARILSTWDAAIDCVQKLLENSRQQKKALMQQLLTGKRKLPGAREKWRKISLGEIFTQRIETGFQSLPLVAITNDKGVIYRDDSGKKDTSSEDKSKYLRICPGDIGYNTMRMWQGVSGLSEIEGIVSPAYTICTPTSHVDPLYIAYLFKHQSMIHRFYQYSQGLVSDTWNLKFHNFSTIVILMPPLSEQRYIARILKRSDVIIKNFEAQLQNIQNQKISLMQQLLTGKRRVKLGRRPVNC